MTAKILDGESLATKIREEVANEAAKLRARGIIPGLGTLLVGDDPPSARYVAMKHADCAEVGIESIHEHLPADITQDDLMSAVERFNSDTRVHAYLVQLPLPAGLDEEEVLLSVDPSKDVDGLHPVNLGLLVMGHPRVLPCTPAGILELLSANGIDLAGRHVVVVGRGAHYRQASGSTCSIEASRMQRCRDGGPHGGTGHGRTCTQGRYCHRGGRPCRPGDAGYDQARSGGGRRRNLLGRPQAAFGRR